MHLEESFFFVVQEYSHLAKTGNDHCYIALSVGEVTFFQGYFLKCTHIKGVGEEQEAFILILLVGNHRNLVARRAYGFTVKINAQDILKVKLGSFLFMIDVVLAGVFSHVKDRPCPDLMNLKLFVVCELVELFKFFIVRIKTESIVAIILNSR